MCADFVHFKHWFWMYLRQPGWLALLNPLTHPIFFLLIPPLDSLGAQTKRIPLAALFKDLHYFFSKNIITCWLASWHFYISYFLSLEEAIINRREETLAAASHELLTKEEEWLARWSFPVRADNTQAHQSFEETLLAGHRSLKTLMSCSPSLRTSINTSPFW